MMFSLTDLTGMMTVEEVEEEGDLERESPPKQRVGKNRSPG